MYIKICQMLPQWNIRLISSILSELLSQQEPHCVQFANGHQMSLISLHYYQYYQN